MNRRPYPLKSSSNPENRSVNAGSPKPALPSQSSLTSSSEEGSSEGVKPGFHLELLTVEELGRLIKMAPHTIRRWVRLGKIPAIRLGYHEIRFEPEKIRRWIKSREQLRRD